MTMYHGKILIQMTGVLGIFFIIFKKRNDLLISQVCSMHKKNCALSYSHTPLCLFLIAFISSLVLMRLMNLEKISFKLEIFKKLFFYLLDHYHCKGSILFQKPSYATRLTEAVLKAALELGYPIKDLNKGLTTGFTIPYLNLNKFGQRWTSDQYLKLSGKTRKNLKVITSAVAEKILLRNNFEAYGVRFRKGGKIYKIFANQEIILSSGTIGSAKLLMMSGIGPDEVLSKTNVCFKSLF